MFLADPVHSLGQPWCQLLLQRALFPLSGECGLEAKIWTRGVLTAPWPSLLFGSLICHVGSFVSVFRFGFPSYAVCGSR